MLFGTTLSSLVNDWGFWSSFCWKFESWLEVCLEILPKFRVLSEDNALEQPNFIGKSGIGLLQTFFHWVFSSQCSNFSQMTWLQSKNDSSFYIIRMETFKWENGS